MPYSPLERLKPYVPLRFKALAREAYLTAAVWRAGGTPDVLLIGVMKGGTTSLFNYLVQHPRIFPGIGKEIWYLSGARLDRGEGWYRRHFLSSGQRKRLERALQGPVLAVDASADSICSPEAPQRAWQINPDARVVAVLRDPVRRAVSQYRFQRQMGDRFGSETLDAEVTRQLDRHEREGIDLQKAMMGPATERLVSQGLYWHMLEPWMAKFGDVCVVESESLFEDPGGETARVLEYLRLAPHDGTRYENFNETKKTSSSVERLSQDVEARLRRFYAEHNRELESLTGQHFRWLSSDSDE